MQNSPFVTKIEKTVVEKLRKDLEDQGFSFTQAPYTVFVATKEGVSCTLYESSKFVVQGKKMKEFIEFYLEPEILKELSYSYKVEKSVDPTGRIGVDEAGKGDFFGPLSVAAVFAEGASVNRLLEIGVKDSKDLSDVTVQKIAARIKAEFQHSIIQIGPKRYNEMYEQFGNLNTLLAWAHATSIENLSKITNCKAAIIDQFAHESVVQKALLKKGLSTIALTQRHKGEEDPVVAAASILARASFLEGLAKLSKEFNINLPKGAARQVIDAGKVVVQKHGQEALYMVCKYHFKTTMQVLENQ